MYGVGALEYEATLTRKRSVDAMAQSRRSEESIMTAMHLFKTERKPQKVIGTARLFIDGGGPLSCIGRHFANGLVYIQHGPLYGLLPVE